MQSIEFPKLSITSNHIRPVAHGYMHSASRWVWQVSRLYICMIPCIPVKYSLLWNMNQDLYVDGYESYFTSNIYTDNLVVYEKNIPQCGHIQVLSTDY